MYGARTGVSVGVQSVVTHSPGVGSPADLFANGEQGWWYDPSDLTTLYQDASGVTPVSAVEQPVGLMLDKRLSLSLGTELLTNNTFATDTVWSKGTGWSIGSGVATKVAGSASLLSQTIAPVTGTVYRVVYTITRSAGTITPRFTGGSTVTGTARSASGTYVDFLTAVSGNVTFELSADATFAGTVDDVYIKRVSGNDAYQATSAARPTLRARYNLLTYSETGASFNADSTTFATGLPGVSGFTSGSFSFSNGTTNYPRGGVDVASGVPTTCSAWLSVSTGTVQVRPYAYYNGAWTDLSGVNFTLTSTPQRFTWSYTPTTATSFGSGWTIRCVYSGAATVVVSGADLRPTNQTTGMPAYQRIAAATDYDTNGFPPYIQGNGSSQFMLTQAIDLTGTAKMTVFSGVRKLSDAATASIAEHGVGGTDALTASYLFAPRNNGSANYGGDLRAGGLVSSYFSTASRASPITNVVTTSMDYTGVTIAAQNTMRFNGVADAGTNSGTGPVTSSGFGNYPLYLLARGGANNWFGGNFYGLIGRGAASNVDEIRTTERYMNMKARAY